MKKTVLAIVSLALVLIAASCAGAEVKLTIVNKRSHALSFAFVEGITENYAGGWYNVKAGETKTFTLENSYPDYFGYYAEGGGYVWQDKNASSDWVYCIDPKESFTIVQGDTVPGGKKVGFREVDLTRYDKGPDSAEPCGRATLTFNP
jgi:hypothetical protein